MKASRRKMMMMLKLALT